MRPAIENFEPYELGPRTWGRELLIAHTKHYIGKILEMKAGKAGGLQYHVDKDETFFLFSGKATLESDADGALVATPLVPGMSIRVPPGAPHRVTAETDCIFFEVSTPHFDDRVRCEVEYGQPEVNGLPTTRGNS